MDYGTHQAQGLAAIAAMSPSPAARRVGRPEGVPFRIAITSGKGGVGKSQISANLAVSLAQDGRRVLLVDADIGMASLDLVLGCAPQQDLMDVLRGHAQVRDVLVPAAHGVMLLPACPGRHEMANLSASDRARAIDILHDASRDFDAMVVDTGAGIGSNALDFAAAADETLVVLTPDPSSLRDAYAMVKVLERRAGVGRVLVVTNQVDDREGARLFARLSDLVQRFLPTRLEHMGSVPRDRAVRDAVIAGEPVLLRAPRSEATRALERVSFRIDQVIARSA